MPVVEGLGFLYVMLNCNRENLKKVTVREQKVRRERWYKFGNCPFFFMVGMTRPAEGGREEIWLYVLDLALSVVLGKSWAH